MHPTTTAAALAAALLLGTGCENSTPTAPNNLRFANVEAPALPDASDFVATVDNPWFPLTPGTVLNYVNEEDGETGRVTVTNQTRTILGISATVVHDEVFADGALLEDTFDWYAQDRWGNVWYLGEASCEFENGVCVNTEGSWEAGVDGAMAGIIMWADPAAHKGVTYQQEFYEDVAEDQAKVLHTGLQVSVAAGDFSNCIETMDFTPLEPGSREHKFYCAGTGLVLEISPKGGRGRNELTN
jgi:hypothetical protein